MSCCRAVIRPATSACRDSFTPCKAVRSCSSEASSATSSCCVVSRAVFSSLSCSRSEVTPASSSDSAAFSAVSCCRSSSTALNSSSNFAFSVAKASRAFCKAPTSSSSAEISLSLTTMVSSAAERSASACASTERSRTTSSPKDAIRISISLRWLVMVSVWVTDSRSCPTSSVFRIRITTRATRKISTTTVMMSVKDGHTLSSSDRPLTVGETLRSTKPSAREIATSRYRLGSFRRKPSRSTWFISISPSLLRCISSR